MDAAIGIAYLVASLCFIAGLRFLSSPETARRGNQIAAVGMTIAIVATLVDKKVGNYLLIGVAMVIGAGLGIYSAREVKMTAMPQMVAIFNGMGGGAAALVSTLEFIHLTNNHASIEHSQGITIALGSAIGAVSFAGSLVAFAKLQELVSGAALRVPFQKAANALLVLVILAVGAWAVLFSGGTPALIILLVLALVLGLLLVFPIGGADMPVVISLMNSLTGLAAALTGFVLSNELLIVSGALVGASGTLLTQLMAKAMNRPLTNVLFGAFGAGASSEVSAAGTGGTVRQTSADDAAVLMSYSRQVVIVPGYGLAVAQAQHQARELAELLIERGVDVKFAIHPVAGRMPGHMNVLLAEANVPYSQLYEMDQINGEFNRTDVVLIVGANDVVNPAARSDPGSPIYGMPILNVDEAGNVIVLKRSMRSGFAGIDNPLFYLPKTAMLFGDARDSLTKLVNAVKTSGPPGRATKSPEKRVATQV